MLSSEFLIGQLVRRQNNAPADKNDGQHDK